MEGVVACLPVNGHQLRKREIGVLGQRQERSDGDAIALLSHSLNGMSYIIENFIHTYNEIWLYLPPTSLLNSPLAKISS